MAARNIIASTANPRDDFETNIGGTLNVLLAARESKVDRVVYTSSTSIYGNPRSIPINEDDQLVPLSPYAVSKLGGENYCLAFYESYGLPTAAVRYSNVFGPGQRPDNPYCGVVCQVPRRAPRGSSRCRSTATASRPATSRTSTTPSRRRFWRRSIRAPKATSSTSAPASRRR